MKILIASHSFFPEIGDVDEVHRILALEFQRRGHEIHVVTDTEFSEPEPFTFAVSRRPRAATLASLARWSDVVLHNGVNLAYIWPLLPVRRPWVITNHSPVQGILRKAMQRLGTNIAVSKSIAKELSVPCQVVGNPYRSSIFRIRPDIRRDTPLAFVGSMETDSGAAILIEALLHLRQEGLTPALTIFGEGSARGELQALVANAALQKQVSFAGYLTDEHLAERYCAHRIAVAPSIGADSSSAILEAIASGCAVIASDVGSHCEAVGDCGWTVRAADATALATQLRIALNNPKSVEERQSHAREHLSQFTAEAVAIKYLRILQAAAQLRRRHVRLEPFAA